MKYTVYVEQNGGEYTGWVTVECDQLTQVNDHKIIADHVVIEFDEFIESIKTGDAIRGT